MKLDLYIEGKKAVISDQDSVILVSSIQEAKDIGKVFTDFSRQFTLPANKINNQLFNHFYRTDITNGFDTRFKVSAEIKLNGATFRKGKLRLNGVNMKNNKPVSYKAIFFGETIILKDILKDDKLSNLNFDEFESPYSPTDVRVGITNGYNLVNGQVLTNFNPNTAGDLIYPLISIDKDYFYSSDDSIDALDSNRINMYKSDLTYDKDYGIKFTSLKPAIKVRKIIDKIQDKYDLQFSDDFFNFDNESYSELFIWLHREKSPLNQLLESAVTTVTLEGFILDRGEEIRNPNNLNEILPSVKAIRFDVFPEFDTDLYNLSVVNADDGRVLKAVNGLKGDESILLAKSEIDGATNVVLKVESETVAYFTTSFAATNSQDFVSFYQLRGFNVDLRLDIGTQMPNIKVIDFLTGIFKLFNLTAYYNKEGVVVVKTLTDYYNDGAMYDITKYVDTSSHQIDKAAIYSELTLGFKDGKTFLTRKRSEIVNEEYGNLVFDSNGTLPYDGEKFKLEVPFEKVLFSRLINDVDKEQTLMGTGWFVDEKKESTLGAPLLFYAIKQDASENVRFDDGVDLNDVPTYIRPSNSIKSGDYTLNFGAEIDEYELVTNENSLFNKYYQDYIEGLYDLRTRRVSYTAYLPYKILLNYKLNDSFIVGNVKYRIEKIESDLKTGKSLLTLISSFDNLISEPVDIIPPNAPTISFIGKTHETITINIEDVNIDNDVVRYDIYIDNILHSGTSSPNTYEIEGLSPSTEYDIKVRAIDTSGNVGVFGNELTITTNATPIDITPPTAPTIAEANRTVSSVEIDINGATDNVGVVGYDIFVNNVFHANTSSTVYNIVGLTEEVLYNITVKAKDAAGNSSLPSNNLIITLGDITPPAVPTGLFVSAFGTDIIIGWNDNTEADLSHYDISIRRDGGGTSVFQSSSSSYNYSTPVSGTYYVKVRAVDDDDNKSAYTSEVSVFVTVP